MPQYKTSIPWLVQINIDDDTYVAQSIFHLPVSMAADLAANPSRKYPTIYMFHGNGGTAPGMDSVSNFDFSSDAYDYVVIYPQGRNTSWDFSGSALDDVNVITQEIQQYWSNILPIDLTRMYVAGYSEGGGMALQMVSRNPGMFAGISLNAINLSNGDATNIAALPQMPVVYFHGTADPIVPYSGGVANSGATVLSTLQSAEVWATLNGCPDVTTPTLTTFSGTLNNGVADVDSCNTWTPGDTGFGVWFYTITGGGHTIPGGSQPVNAAGNLNGQSELLGPSSITLSMANNTWLRLSAYSV